MLTEAYRADLARIHDEGFGNIAREGGTWLVDFLRRRRTVGGRVVVLGSGSGIEAEILSQSGFDVLGFDLSPAMVAIARARVPHAEFRVGSLFTTEILPCVAVTAIGECCNYLFDGRSSRRALAGLFRRVYKALAPGGLFLFDVATPGRAPGGVTRGFREGDGWTVLFEAVENARRRELTRRITTFCKTGVLFRRDVEVHRLRLYAPAEIRAALRRAGFRVRTMPGYGATRMPGWIVFLATKPGKLANDE